MGGIPQPGGQTATDSPHHRQHYDRSGANEVLGLVPTGVLRLAQRNIRLPDPPVRAGRLQTPRTFGNDGSPQATNAGTRKLSAMRP